MYKVYRLNIVSANNQPQNLVVQAPATMSMTDVIAGVQKSLGVTNDPSNIGLLTTVDLVLS